jgi:hypothetical protein
MSESEETQPQVGTVTSTGEVVMTQPVSNTNTEPALKTQEDYMEYSAAVNAIRNMQVEDPMGYQAEHGYYPTPGDTSIDKRGLTSEQQEGVLKGEYNLEVIDEAKQTFRAEKKNPA